MSRLFLAALLCCFTANVLALPSAKVKHVTTRAETPEKSDESLVLPYAFSTETMGLNIGIAGMRSGYHQDQMSIAGTAFAGDVSHAVMAGIWNYQIPRTERLYFSTSAMQGYYPDKRAYSSPSSLFVPAGTPLPGGNDSLESQFIQADGYSNWWDIKLEYSLPIGATANKGTIDYTLRDGLLDSEPSGGEVWDPLSSGASVLILRQFNRYESYEREGQHIDGRVHGVELGLLYNNTDFPVNPSRGSSQYVAINHDPGWFESQHKWTFIEAELSKYYSLGKSEQADQRILALNFWTGSSPLWEVEEDGSGGRRVVNGTPFNEGATLGGLYRMRGYDQNRFHDKAVVYGTAEYRYTLKYNPIANVSWLQFAKLDWFQLVGFVEAGRVAPEYSANELLRDLKTDYGMSLRALTAGIVVRLDLATSPEGTNLWVMFDHPF
ncbi:MAG: BamA/TamA family outer membrane protein [Halopseudomonas sp.]